MTFSVQSATFAHSAPAPSTPNSLSYSIHLIAPGDVLHDTFVHALYRDPQGFVWAGTGKTVERLGGKGICYNFEGVASITGYAPCLVNAMVQLHDGRFFVGNSSGLWQLNHKTQLVERAFDNDIKASVNCLTETTDGRMLVGTDQGLYQVDGTEVTLLTQLIYKETRGATQDRILAIDAHDKQAYWALTSKGVQQIVPASGAKAEFACPSLNICGSLTAMVRKGNTLYIGTQRGGIVCFSIARQQFFSPSTTSVPASALPAYQQFLANPCAINALDIKGDTLAVATSGQGLFLLKAPTLAPLYHSTHQDQGGGLVSSRLSSVLLTEGHVWCGTEFYLGLNYLIDTSTPARIFTEGSFSSANLSVRSVLHTPDHTFIGTLSGFYVADHRTHATTHYTAAASPQGQLRSDLIFSFHRQRDGVVLVGTCRGGLSAFRPETRQYVETPLTRAITTGDVFQFVEEKNGTLWAATSVGLFRQDGATGTVKSYTAASAGMPGAYVYNICRDSQGRVWLSTDKGNCLFNERTGRCTTQGIPEELLMKSGARSVNKTSDGRLFFISLNYQAVVADRQLRTIKHLPYTVFNVGEDRQKRIWMSNGGGLVQLSADLEHTRFFSFHHLLSSQNGLTSGPRLTLDPQTQTLWLPAVHGLVIFDTQHLPAPRPVRLTEALVNGKTHESFESNDGEEPSLRLGSGERNITLRYASLAYEHPDFVRYEYWLEGSDSTWSAPTAETEASYFNLPSGTYRFHVRRMLDDSSTATITITIGYPWTTILCFALLAVGIIGGGWWLWRRRRALPQAVIEADEAQMPYEQQEQTESEQRDAPEGARLSVETAAQLTKALHAYMAEAPYLDTELKQSTVAARLGCSASDLSLLFTRHMDTTYYDYINTLRVEAFKEAVARGDGNRYTLMALAERCGFKSKATFYRAFKRVMGVTPNEYLKQ